MSVREQIQEAWESEADGHGKLVHAVPGKKPSVVAAQAIRERRVCQIKADAVKRQFEKHPGRNRDGVLAINTSQGDAEIHRIEVTETDGVACVDVWLSNGAEPEFRLVNPPILVEDPAGPVALRGRKYREDPVAAVAEVVAAQQRRGRR